MLYGATPWWSTAKGGLDTHDAYTFHDTGLLDSHDLALDFGYQYPL